ncbi:MAG TPA: hypothetical protein DDY89_03435 [Lysinibacillus sp.]|nr:hypothetical protein [Lysinibacillus sp.]
MSKSDVPIFYTRAITIRKKRGKRMKKFIGIFLVCAILPRVITINLTVNNHINVHQKDQKS